MATSSAFQLSDNLKSPIEGPVSASCAERKRVKVKWIAGLIAWKIKAQQTIVSCQRPLLRSFGGELVVGLFKAGAT